MENYNFQVEQQTFWIPSGARCVDKFCALIDRHAPVPLDDGAVVLISVAQTQ